uniref:Sulfotransferase n=1 Tax=Ciona savignyi TaxID=51511 RepID=H2Y837_CIOSA
MQAMFKPLYAKYSYENWLPREGDVLIATFPKCGTHWCMEIVANLAFEAEKVDFYRKAMLLPILEAGPEKRYELFDKIPSPRSMMTHQPHFNVNIEKYLEQKMKIVVVYRNPKDVAVSFYHFQLKTSPPPVRIESWNEYVKLFMEGPPRSFCRPGETYLDHFLGWYQHRNNKQILLLCYEEMKLNPEKEIRKLSDFLGLSKTDEEIARVVDITSLASMKKQQEAGGNEVNAIRKKANLVRKGIIGDWKSHFTVAQSEAMDKLVEEKTKGMDFKFIFSA